jgi:hypothetical protein
VAGGFYGNATGRAGCPQRRTEQHSAPIFDRWASWAARLGSAMVLAYFLNQCMSWQRAQVTSFRLPFHVSEAGPQPQRVSPLPSTPWTLSRGLIVPTFMTAQHRSNPAEA